MTRRLFLLPLFVVLGFASLSSAEDAPRGPWNIVLVLSDALRASSMGTYGYGRETTPFLDGMAKESLVFEHAFAHYPGTPVSISQLHTGAYAPPLLMGARIFAIPVRQIPETYPILPRALRKAGFRTGIVSSHYWWKDDSRLLDFFDDVAIVPSSESYAPFEELLPAVDAFLEEAGDQPFFLYVHSMDTHGPWSDVDPDLEREGWPAAYAAYDTDIRRTDRGVRALKETLQKRGLWDKTVFVFTSDHGEEFGELGPEPWNRNHGLQIRRPLVEVPLLVRLPEGRGAGRYKNPVGLVDLAPTLVPLAAPSAHLAKTDGRDLSQTWLAGTESDPDHVLFAYSGRWRGAYQQDTELLYDPWERKAQLFRIERDAHNYPRQVPIDDPKTSEALRTALDGAHERWTKHHESLPSLVTLSDPATIHVPFQTTPGSATTPVFPDDANDGRWSHSGPALIAAPGEKVPPIRLEQPWAPGRYRVVLRLGEGDAGEPAEWNRDLEVSFDGGPVLRPEVPPDGRSADLGTVSFSNPRWEMTVAAPKGAVAIRGLEFSSAAAPDGGDPAIAEKLKALGYGD